MQLASATSQLLQKRRCELQLLDWDASVRPSMSSETDPGDREPDMCVGATAATESEDLRSFTSIPHRTATGYHFAFYSSALLRGNSLVALGRGTHNEFFKLSQVSLNAIIGSLPSRFRPAFKLTGYEVDSSVGPIPVSQRSAFHPLGIAE